MPISQRKQRWRQPRQDCAVPVAQSKGRLDVEYLISKGGFPGRDLRVSGPAPAAQHLEIYLVGGGRYVLGVTAVSSAGIFSRDVRRFFDSFRIATNQAQ